jgi:serine/threonine-protein kinase
VSGGADSLARARALEEACDFVAASQAALEGGDPRWAARLAALGGDREAFDAAASALGAEARSLEAAAMDLASRRLHAFAATLFERAGDHRRAAESFAAASDPIQAAAAFDRAGLPADGARVLERAIAENDDSDGLRLVLAELCARHGRVEASVRAIQAMRPGSPERARALPLLARSLRALGLSEAAREVDIEVVGAGQLDRDASAPPPVREQPAPPASSGAVYFGRYEVTREVAKTPHAHLFDATDRLTGKRVALKILATPARGTGRDAFVRFEREARALMKLRHPSVVPLVAWVPDGPALVLEWMPGGSLAELLRVETFAPARAAEIAAAVLLALGEAHRLGILHRDVKPSNVLFDDVGAPRLSDFGAAHLGDLSTTATAGAIGTFSYMSPEQRLGKPATVRSDLYAAGALLYEMLTGEAAQPQTGGFVERPPSAYHEDLSPRHDAVVAALLAEAEADRPEDAFAARRLLESVSWPTRVSPRPEPAAARTRSSRPPPGARLAPPRDPGDARDALAMFDTVIERHIVVFPLDPQELARAAAFARAAHPALALVLRASRADQEIWVERPRGRAIADDAEPLSQAEIARLEAALRALHAQQGAHGAVDAEHVYRFEGEITLAYPRRPAPAASAETDLAALGSLVTRSSGWSRAR